MKWTLKLVAGVLILLSCVAANALVCDVYSNGIRHCYEVDKSKLTPEKQNYYDTHDCVRTPDGSFGYNEKCTPKPTPQQISAQQAEQQAATRVIPFTDSNKQFQVTCPTETNVVLSPPPPGFAVQGGGSQVDLVRVDHYGSTLTCHYRISNHSSGVLYQSFDIASQYQYTATGKQCGRSKNPCKDASCALVCSK